MATKMDSIIGRRKLSLLEEAVEKDLSTILRLEMRKLLRDCGIGADGLIASGLEFRLELSGNLTCAKIGGGLIWKGGGFKLGSVELPLNNPQNLHTLPEHPSCGFLSTIHQLPTLPFTSSNDVQFPPNGDGSLASFTASDSITIDALSTVSGSVVNPFAGIDIPAVCQTQYYSDIRSAGFAVPKSVSTALSNYDISIPRTYLSGIQGMYQPQVVGGRKRTQEEKSEAVSESAAIQGLNRTHQFGTVPDPCTYVAQSPVNAVTAQLENSNISAPSIEGSLRSENCTEITPSCLPDDSLPQRMRKKQQFNPPSRPTTTSSTGTIAPVPSSADEKSNVCPRNGRKSQAQCGQAPRPKPSKRKTGKSLEERIWYGIYKGPRVSRYLVGEGVPNAAKEISCRLQRIKNVSSISQEEFSDLNTNLSAYFSTPHSLRLIDLLIQATWVSIYNLRVQTLSSSPMHKFNTATDNNITALTEARTAFGCSEKEMRNKLAIWSGYKKIKDIGGWASLVFGEEGGGVYTICKYRVGWKDGVFDGLEKNKLAIEVAADTIQKSWRNLLEVVFGEDDEEVRNKPVWWGGHPHMWVIDNDGKPITLSESYKKFGGLNYKFIEDSIIDLESWPGSMDPRTVHSHQPNPNQENVAEEGKTYTCLECHLTQSNNPIENKCQCFPDLFGFPPSSYPLPASHRSICVPVQIQRTNTGKNNGLFSRLPLTSGKAVCEFVGLITTGIKGVDVMEGFGTSLDSVTNEVKRVRYQIAQMTSGMGNVSRFVNHSCDPNCRFERFVWRGKERIIIVVGENGVKAGEEITVDYGGGYWEGLDKICRCGAGTCRYPRGSAVIYDNVGSRLLSSQDVGHSA